MEAAWGPGDPETEVAALAATPGRAGCGLVARCLIVPAFSLANGIESDSVLEVDLKLASDPCLAGG